MSNNLGIHAYRVNLDVPLTSTSSSLSSSSEMSEVEKKTASSGHVIIVNTSDINYQSGQKPSAELSIHSTSRSLLEASTSVHDASVMRDPQILNELRIKCKTIFVFLQHLGADESKKSEAYAALQQLNKFIEQYGVEKITENDLNVLKAQENLVEVASEVFVEQVEESDDAQTEDWYHDNFYDGENTGGDYSDYVVINYDANSVAESEEYLAEQQPATPLKIQAKYPDRATYNTQIDDFVAKHSELELTVAKYKNQRSTETNVELRARHFYGTTLEGKAHGYGREYFEGKVTFEGCYVHGRRLVNSDRLWKAILVLTCADAEAALKTHQKFKATFVTPRT